MKTINNDELYHYGILGMKWGVRREQNRLNRIDQKSKKKNWSSDTIEFEKLKTKKVSQMSNAELTKYNNRKNLERNYSQFNPNLAKRGLAIAGTVAAALGTVTAIYSNGGKVIEIGKKVASKIARK